MNAASHNGPTYAKAILHMSQAADTYNPISSPASSEFTPPLTQSTSGSNKSRSNFDLTSQSPPQPTTPPLRYNHARQYQSSAAAKRPMTRYPSDLARAGDGRTPLHRRGTSQKYEPFEDLLREAGYKETRIFTPETERIASRTDGRDGSSGGKGTVAGVVEFLSGFIPGSRTSSLRENSKATKDHYSPPTSPSPSSMSISRKRSQTVNSELERELQKQLVEDEATPRATRTRNSLSVHPTLDTTPSPVFCYTHNNHSYTSIGQSSSSKQMPPPLPLSNDKNITYLDHRPSRATAYLKHIASVPDIPGASLQRSHSNIATNARRRRTTRRSGIKDSHYVDDDEDDDFNSVYEGRTRGNGEGEEDTNVPPLPKGWLETVARAVLFGTGGPHSLIPNVTLQVTESTTGSRAVSQPHPNSQPSSYTKEISPALRRLRQTRSVVSRTGSLADAPSVHRRHHHQHHGLIRTQSARSALSSRSGMSDRTNRTYGNWATAMPSPLSGIKSASVGTFGISRPRPTLMIRLDNSSRSNTSEGEIRQARVVCRSAPASRATSPNPNPMTPTFGRHDGIIPREEQRKQSSHKKANRKQSKTRPRLSKATDEPPSLTHTMLELEGDGTDYMDIWLSPSSRPHKQQQGRNHKSGSVTGLLTDNRYLSGWGWDSNQSSAQPTSQADYDSDGISHFRNPPLSLSTSVTNINDGQSASEGEESSENEVDLAKMLRPKPQRQETSNSTKSGSSLRSIRSLRKLLVPSESGADRHDIPPVPPLPSSFDFGNGRDPARHTVDLTPPTSAIGRWILDSEGSYADGNDRYGTKSVRGKRGSLPSGWIGTGYDIDA